MPELRRLLAMATVAPAAAAAAAHAHEVVAAPGTWPRDPFAFDPSQCSAGGACHGMSLGNHRVEVEVSVAAAAAHRAVVAAVAWRRRLSPRVDFAKDVVGVFLSSSGGGRGSSTASVLTNLTVANASAASALIAFEPSFGAGLYSFYFLPYKFSGGSGSYTSVFGVPPSPTVCSATAATRTAWRPNNAKSLESSTVTHTSGQVWPANAAWKAADGDLRFEMVPSASACSVLPAGVPQPAGTSCQGWDGLQGWPEFIVFDLGNTAVIARERARER